MARTRRTSASETVVLLASFRFRLLGFEVKIWRANEWPRMIFPPAVSLNRLAAPLWVFNFNLTFAKTALPKKQVSGARFQVSASPSKRSSSLTPGP